MPGPQRVREQGERPPVSQLHFGWSRRSRPFYRTRSEHERIGLRLPARIPDLRLAQNQNRRTVVRSHGQGHADLSMFAAVRSCLRDRRLAGRGFCVFVNGREGRRRGARFRSLPSLDPDTVHSPSATHRCLGSRPGPVPASDPWGGAQTHRSADHGARMCSGTVRIGRSLAGWQRSRRSAMRTPPRRDFPSRHRCPVSGCPRDAKSTSTCGTVRYSSLCSVISRIWPAWMFRNTCVVSLDGQ